MNEPSTMTERSGPPPQLDGAKVVMFTYLDGRHRSTGGCQHIVSGKPMERPCGLAICQYDGAADYYLFYCDSLWNVLNDTYHDSLADAQSQAEFEFEGTRNTWNLTGDDQH